MARESSVKSITRNRKPRVHIVYEVDIAGATKKIELPFVMGVMADLSGDSVENTVPLAERSFSEFDSDNFNDRMKAIKPRVAVQVPNTLTGEGNMSIDLTFESMDDFSPAAIARKVPALAELLNTRTQLANLRTYMDGKDAAESLVAELLNNPALLKTLSEHPKSDPTAE